MNPTYYCINKASRHEQKKGERKIKQKEEGKKKQKGTLGKVHRKDNLKSEAQKNKQPS